MTWVLLRGLLRERRHWASFPDALEKKLKERVICLDIPGVGERVNERSPNRISYLVDDLREQLHNLQIRPPLKLLGLSMGGMIATDWAMSFPDEVDSLLLINSSFRNFNPAVQRLNPRYLLDFVQYARISIAEREKLLLKIVVNDSDRRSESEKLWHQIALSSPVTRVNSLRQLEAAFRYLAPKEAPSMPCLIVASQADRLVDAACSRKIAEIWKAQLRVHKSAGHDLIIDASEWLLEQICNWQQSSKA